MKHNGRYCKSGMATQLHPDGQEELQKIAMCTSTNFIQEALGSRDGVQLNEGQPSYLEQFANALEIPSPYQCDPTNNHNFCWLAYNAEDNVNEELQFVATECKCALDGNRGFCGEIIGTTEYS